MWMGLGLPAETGILQNCTEPHLGKETKSLAEESNLCDWMPAETQRESSDWVHLSGTTTLEKTDPTNTSKRIAKSYSYVTRVAM